MQIYKFALGIMIFVLFTSVVQQMGVFGNVYSHTAGTGITINTSDVEGIKKISGEAVLSGEDLTNSNPDIGGIFGLINGIKFFYNIIDNTLNIDKIIMDYTPPSAEDIVQPFATFAARIMQVVYIVGILSYLRRFKVG